MDYNILIADNSEKIPLLGSNHCVKSKLLEIKSGNETSPRSRVFLEVIHLQVPLQIPCYDLTLLVEGGLEYAIKRSLTHPQLRWFDGRCVQGAGAYSPCYVETRLLRNPASRGRVTALDPYYEQVSG